jgi:hypothetical protein
MRLPCLRHTRRRAAASSAPLRLVRARRLPPAPRRCAEPPRRGRRAACCRRSPHPSAPPLAPRANVRLGPLPAPHKATRRRFLGAPPPRPSSALAACPPPLCGAASPPPCRLLPPLAAPQRATTSASNTRAAPPTCATQGDAPPLPRRLSASPERGACRLPPAAVRSHLAAPPCRLLPPLAAPQRATTCAPSARAAPPACAAQGDAPPLLRRLSASSERGAGRLAPAIFQSRLATPLCCLLPPLAAPQRRPSASPTPKGSARSEHCSHACSHAARAPISRHTHALTLILTACGGQPPAAQEPIGHGSRAGARRVGALRNHASCHHNPLQNVHPGCSSDRGGSCAGVPHRGLPWRSLSHPTHLVIVLSITDRRSTGVGAERLRRLPIHCFTSARSYRPGKASMSITVGRPHASPPIAHRGGHVVKGMLGNIHMRVVRA